MGTLTSMASCSEGQTATAPPARYDGGTTDASGDSSACTPTTCLSADLECGQAPNGCGGVLECGACSAGESCGGAGVNRCGTKPCTPLTCASAGAVCGSLSDGCSTVLQCGSCPGTQQCDNHQCLSTGQGGAAGAGGAGGSAGTGGAASVSPVAVSIDEHPGVSSNANGLLEPGESVLVEPTWKNDGSGAVVLQGTATSFLCPAGAVCSILDAAAGYGTIQPGAAASCTATGDCFGLSVSLASGRPAEDWDATFVETAGGVSKTWSFHLGGTFSDVDPTVDYYIPIEILVHHGITTGCGGTAFCPEASMTRFQAAVWFARAMAGSDGAVPTSGSVPSLGGSYDCSSGGVSLFADVGVTDMYCKHVHYLAREGVTSGCAASPPGFCPNAVTLRGQGAAMLARALAGSDAAVPQAYADGTTGRSYDCSGADSHFTDTPAGSTYCRYANYLWARGMLEGCASSSFCPDADLLRRDGARLLVRGFALTLD